MGDPPLDDLPVGFVRVTARKPTLRVFAKTPFRVSGYDSHLRGFAPSPINLSVIHEVIFSSSSAVIGVEGTKGSVSGGASPGSLDTGADASAIACAPLPGKTGLKPASSFPVRKLRVSLTLRAQFKTGSLLTRLLDRAVPFRH